MKENIKEWFSTVLGMVILSFLAYNFFSQWPRTLSLVEKATVFVIGGVFVFGNVKAFISQIQAVFIKKLER